MPVLELFGTAGCPHTREMREWLEWRGRDFLEYDVELDRAALARMRELTGGQRIVPVLDRRRQSDSVRLAGPRLCR